MTTVGMGTMVGATMNESHGLKAKGLDGAEWETLWCLFRHGATWDGNIPSKSARERLITYGLAYRDNGWTVLTIDGFHAAIAAGMAEKKGTR